MNSLVSDVFYFNKLSELKESIRASKDFLIYDKALLGFEASKKVISSFAASYGVDAGELLKDLNSFPNHFLKILDCTKAISFKDSKIVIMGGGSVGDFGGFVASTLKRGVPFIQIPSTWLAAIDSSHGGKTALNVGAYKNQIGSFHAADSVMIVKELLDSNPKVLEQQAWGEAYKMLLISKSDIIQKRLLLENNRDALWDLLPSLVSEKYLWVEKDPYEKTGARRVLNLGHTVGHVLEKALNLSHGWAVGQGLHFSLRWSECRFDIDLSIEKAALEKIIPYKKSEEGKVLPAIKDSVFLDILSQDKKKSANNSNEFQIGFIFINNGPKVDLVSLKEILNEAKSQGLV